MNDFNTKNQMKDSTKYAWQLGKYTISLQELGNFCIYINIFEQISLKICNNLSYIYVRVCTRDAPNGSYNWIPNVEHLADRIPTPT